MGIKGTRLTAVVALSALLLGACGDDGDDDAGAPEPTSASSTTAATTTTTGGDGGDDDDAGACTEERQGGELTFGSLIPTQAVDPTKGGSLGSSGAAEHAALYDTLMRYEPSTGEFVPHIAASVEPNDDFSVWTVELREGVEFGNGDLLTAEDVKFSIERFNGAPVTGARMVALIDSIDVVDELTLEITLVRPWANFPFVLASEVGGPVNPALVQERGDAFAMNPTGAGVGPFEFVSWAPEEALVLEAKDNYWGGPVCLDTLRFINVPTGTATYDAFENGEVQGAFLRTAKDIAEAKDDGVEGLSDVIGAGWTINLNNGAGAMATSAATIEVRVRKAIAAGIDLDQINERIDEGEGMPTGALVPDGWPFDPGVDGPAHDPDAARALVAEAKAAGWDGQLSLICGPLYGDLPVLVEGQLEAVGFEVEVETISTNDLISRYLAGNYEAACFAINVYSAAPEWALEGFRSTAAAGFTGYKNPALDAILDDIAEGADLQTEMGKAQELWNETVPSIILNATEEFVALAPEVHGVILSQTTTPMFHDAYIDG